MLVAHSIVYACQRYADGALHGVRLVHVQVRKQYCGDRYPVTGDFECKVKFEGNSVIDGFKQLVAVGGAVLPLPSYLADLHSSAQNRFVLEDKEGDV